MLLPGVPKLLLERARVVWCGGVRRFVYLCLSAAPSARPSSAPRTKRCPCLPPPLSQGGAEAPLDICSEKTQLDRAVLSFREWASAGGACPTCHAAYERDALSCVALRCLDATCGTQFCGLCKCEVVSADPAAAAEQPGLYANFIYAHIAECNAREHVMSVQDQLPPPGVTSDTYMHGVTNEHMWQRALYRHAPAKAAEVRYLLRITASHPERSGRLFTAAPPRRTSRL